MEDRAAYHAAGAAPQSIESSTAAASTPAAMTGGTGEGARAKSKSSAPAGLTFPRFFTEAGIDPFDEIEWDLRAAIIGNEKGDVVFEQRDVEIPKSWSQQATNIVVSKYFRGQMGAPEREFSVRQLIGRVVDTITRWAQGQDYFSSPEALQSSSHQSKHLLVSQQPPL